MLAEGGLGARLFGCRQVQTLADQGRDGLELRMPCITQPFEQQGFAVADNHPGLTQALQGIVFVLWLA